MKRKHRVWYSLERLGNKCWYCQGKWYTGEDAQSLGKNFSSNIQFSTLKQVSEHLNKQDNLTADFQLVKHYIKHGKRWAKNIKIFAYEK